MLLQDRAAHAAAVVRRRRPGAPHDQREFGRESVVSHEVQEPGFEAEHEAHLAFAEARRALGDRVEHRLDVGR
jgi:hypothetical protein